MKEFFVDYIKEIAKLAQIGLEHSILSSDTSNKKIFLDILVKTELLIQNKQTCTEERSVMPKLPTGRTYIRTKNKTKNDMHVIAFCFSYFEHTSLYPDYNQNDAFSIASQILGVKLASLRNIRDYFDGHNSSSRKGWWQSDLPNSMQQFKELYEKKEKVAIITEAKQILGLG